MNVLEQTQELGMLRAIGMPRRQLMRTVLAQAVLIGVLGLAAGAFSGFLLAATINLSLASLFGHSVQFALRPDLVALLVDRRSGHCSGGRLGSRLAGRSLEPDLGDAFGIALFAAPNFPPCRRVIDDAPTPPPAWRGCIYLPVD